MRIRKFNKKSNLIKMRFGTRSNPSILHGLRKYKSALNNDHSNLIKMRLKSRYNTRLNRKFDKYERLMKLKILLYHYPIMIYIVVLLVKLIGLKISQIV